MKNRLIAILLAFSLGTSFSQSIVWGPETIVGDGASNGYTRPRLEVNENGDIFVLTTKNGSGAIYVTKGNGITFDSSVAVVPSGMTTYIANWTGPDMAVKGDTVIVVFKAQPFDEGKVYSVRSTDGGQSFSDTILVDSHVGGMSWMPSMAMDDAGNPIVTYMAHDANSTNPRYVYVSSNDAGQTYELEQNITSTIPGEACDCCPAELAASGDKRILLFRNNESNVRDIYASYSNDAGATFPYNDNVDELNWFLQSCPSTGPHGLIDDTILYTVYTSQGGGDNRSYISRSSLNGGVTFIDRFMFPESQATNSQQNFPRIDKEGNLIVLTWSESESNNFEVYTTYSETGDFADFAANKSRVNTETSGYQSNPDVKILNGYIHIVYQDNKTGDAVYRRGQIGFAGLADLEVNKLKVFPNPVIAGGTVQVSESDAKSIELINMKGATISTLHPLNNGELQIPNVDAGVYTIKLLTKEGRIRQSRINVLSGE